MRQLADFVGNHVASRPALQEAHTSVLLLLQSLAARGYSRTGLPVALAAAVAAATALKAYRQKQQEDGGGQLAPDGWMDLSLAALADVAAGVGQHPGPAFQLRQLQSVLEAAHAATWLPTESARYISDRFCTQARKPLQLSSGRRAAIAPKAPTWPRFAGY